MKCQTPIFFGTAGLLLSLSFAVQVSANPMDECILDMFQKSGDSMTIGEIKQACLKPESGVTSADAIGPIENRLSYDEEHRLQPFTLMAHKPNFFMATYDSSRGDIENYGGAGYTAELDDVELQFQISIKTPLAIDLFEQKIDLYAAYTNRSYWQAFNDEDQNASFFRETNHEPEVWIQKRHDIELPLGFHYKLTAVGIVHQSNGRGGDHSVNSDALSRSWDRLYASFMMENGNFVLVVKPWYRIPENGGSDNNKDLTDYMGHGHIRVAYKLNKHTFSLMSRNNIESGFSEGAVEASWSFPLWNYPYVKGYVQYFTGYGESLTDYDQYNNRIGLGISLSDWL